ncbi:MAG: winged helix-turn-helix transcriptional regulator [Gemmatimonadota bacterium]|nr:winged helix-turn-helix transcriptional regulator [Gemmatimonadota bacterium]
MDVLPKSSEKSSEKDQNLEKSSEKTDVEILTRLAENPDMTISKLAGILGVTTRAIEKQLAKLQEQGRLRRVGPARGGHWEVLN